MAGTQLPCVPWRRIVFSTALLYGLLCTAVAPAIADDAPPNASAPIIISLEDSDPAIRHAREALRDLSHARSLPEMAECLTNRSAGTVGMMAVHVLSFALGVRDDERRKSDPDQSLEQDLKEFVEGQIAAVHADRKSKRKDDFPGLMQGLGRTFVFGLDEFVPRVRRISPTIDLDFTGKFPDDMHFYTFWVVDPSHVRIMPEYPDALNIPGVDVLDAVIEDGKWRIDLGDPNRIFPGSPQSEKGRYEAAVGTDPETARRSEQLFKAVKDNKIDVIKALLTWTPKLANIHDAIGRSPLYTAVVYGRTKAAELLVSQGAHIVVRDVLGTHPLHNAFHFHKPNIYRTLRRGGKKILRWIF